MWLNAIRTFGLRIKQFLTPSIIEFLDILETPSYFVLPPWCIRPPEIVLDMVHLMKDRPDASQKQFISNYSWKFETGTNSVQLGFNVHIQSKLL